jgi:DNA-binding transcriptional LysR family regulator
MSMSILPISLRYFAQVARSGSFRGASEQLHVAASAVNRQIVMLEDELGAPLFERNKGRKPLRMTAAGEVLILYVKRFGADLDKVRSDIEALKGMRKGEIRLGITEGFVHDFVPDLLAKFHRTYPRITFHVEVAGTPRLTQMVAADDLDLALTYNAEPVADVDHILHASLPTCIVVPNGHPLAAREFVRLSDCVEYGFAVPDSQLSAKYFTDAAFARAKVKPRVVLTTNSYELLRNVSAAGMSIAMVNEYVTPLPLGVSGCTYVPLKDPAVQPQQLSCCVRTGRNLPVPTLMLIDRLKKEFETFGT